jgi:hypothetical protein
VGIIVDDASVVRGIQQVFEQDWALTPAAKKEAEEKKDAEHDNAKDEAGDAKATQPSSPG